MHSPTDDANGTHISASNSKPLRSPFDFDDAFSDGEDENISFELSSDAIRQELARNLHTNDSAWEGTHNASLHGRFFQAQDTSVSTIDIGGRALDHSESAASLPRSPEDSEMSSHFSQISLSDDHVNGNEPGPEDKPRTDEDAPHDTPDVPYPSVLIDASKSPQHRVSLSYELESRGSEPASDTAATSPPSSRPSSPAASTSDVIHLSRILQTSHSAPNSPNNAVSSTLAPVPPPMSSSFTNLAVPDANSKPFGHRPTRSVGPSTFEKVRSKTRPSFLPPKSRQEDDKHMADWESMMKLSRAAAERRRKALEERRLARERKIEASLHIWEKEIVPDWRVVNKNPALRRLWWGGIPTKLRAKMWESAVGNPLALNKDNYRTCLARAKRALSSGTFPTTSLSLIEDDIAYTLPALHIFNKETGPLYGDLKEMLCAWVVSRSDEGLGYTKGVAKIAAMFLINMPPQQGFIVMRNLLERHCMRSFYGGIGTKDDVEAYYRIFDTLLADGMPKIYFNFKQHQISPAAYLPDWLLPLFLDHLPFEACARVWDVLLLEGDSFLYRAALGILAVLEPRLFFPDRKELLELLKGENKAALDVARREGRPMNEGKYVIYGVDEETLWERIDSMDDWWKESTWTRLIQRELPDM